MQRSYYLMREVARYHEVQVVAFRQHAHQPDAKLLDEAKEALSSFANLSHVSDLPEARMRGGRPALALRSLLPGPPYTIRWGTCRDYARAVRTAIEQFRPEIVHFDTVSLAPYLDLIGNTRAALNHHNIESHMLLRRAELEANPLKKLYLWQEGQRLKAYERKVANRFQLHLVCSPLDAQRLISNTGMVAVKEVPNGVDLEYFRPVGDVQSQDPNTLIFVGRMSWYPNTSAIRFFLKQIWPQLVAMRPDAEIKIIGRDPPADLVDAGMRDRRIKVMGFVDDIRPLVSASSVYVCPIFDGGGTKLKMIDAMAMGKAIVAHPVAAEGLKLEHGRNVLLAKDPGDFAQHCIRLFDNPELRSDLGESASRLAERAFGFDAIGKTLAGFYADLC